MPLKTVRVPPEMEAAFAQAEELVARYFRDRHDDPEHGTIEIFGERYVLVRAASLSVEFFSLVQDLFGPGREREAEAFARNILFDLAHAIGKSDAQTFHQKMGLVDPIARLSAGPVHFAYSGWAFVDISPESRPGEDYYLVYDHPYSFESDAWQRAGRSATFPVCIMNAGYSSGWCEASFGIELVSSEILCRARGDEACRFVMAHPGRIEEHVRRYIAGAPHLAPRIGSYEIPDFFSRKRVEEELRKSQDELERRVEQRTAELREANERLLREMAEREQVERRLRQTHKLEAIGRLAGGIAHDFNNLMGVVIGHSSMLARRVGGDEPMRMQLDEITRAGKQAARLTQQLLAFSRAQLVEPEIVDLGEIVADLGGMLRRLIGDDLELVVAPPAGPLTIRADRGQMEQILVNLVVNARDAMPRGGTLVIETSWRDLSAREAAEHELAPGRHVVLTVTDTGVGIEDETMAKIFDPFFTTKEEGKGTGLGLSTVYGIVKQSGGGIGVRSQPGRGSAFFVMLPLVSESAEPRTDSAPESMRPGSETVLLVEDQEQLREMLALVLRGQGFVVLEARGPEEALQLAAAHAGPIDALLTDVVMPKMSGREMARRLLEERPRLRVLYMSGYADAGPDGAGSPDDGAALLHKPFSPDALTQKLRQVLDSREQIP